MKKTCFYITTLLCILFSAHVGVAQDYQQMREQIMEKQQLTRAEIEELNTQIQQYEERLELAVEKYEALFKKYEDLQRVIALQDEKLSKLQTEQSQISEEISLTQQSLREKREELQRLVTSYKETLSYLYKHGRTSQLAILFSSASINQMLVRSYYLEKFNSFREKQVNEIRQAEQDLEHTKQDLEQAQAKNADVLAEIKEEKADLAEKKKQQERNVALLRQNKEQIQEKLEESRRQKEELNNTLAKFIREEEEIRKMANSSSTPPEGENFIDDSSLREIEENFALRKGDLPWPVDSRTISARFGNRRHPVYGTVTPNLGVVIDTKPEAEVRVVHDGYVINVQPIPGYGDVVVVKHGRYFTAYGNLSEIHVRKNQVLQQGDMVGLSGNEYSVKGESLFFLVRENNNNMNPENWLRSDAVTAR